jgi:hypothetical protein
VTDTGAHHAPWLKAAAAAVNDLWREFETWAGDMPPPDSQAYAERRRAFVMGAGMMRRRAMLIVLQDIAKRRPLDAHESGLMLRILERERHKRPRWRWTEDEDRKIKALMRRRESAEPLKPYTKNPEVARLAKRLGRSREAIHMRMRRLRNCSDASNQRPG